MIKGFENLPNGRNSKLLNLWKEKVCKRSINLVSNLFVYNDQDMGRKRGRIRKSFLVYLVLSLKNTR